LHFLGTTYNVYMDTSAYNNGENPGHDAHVASIDHVELSTPEENHVNHTGIPQLDERFTRQIREDLKESLHQHRAASEYHVVEHKKHQAEAQRLEQALEALGDPCAVRVRMGRCEALRNYLCDHPSETVTTRLLRQNPAKYGILTSSPRLQLNWLYGDNNPTAKKFFEVVKGTIHLRPGINRSTPPCT